MSKRYGRNQRRAHRTRIAELEKELAATRRRAAQLDADCREYNREIECAKRIVGEYCVAFEPRILAMQLKRSDFAKVMQYEQNTGVNLGRYWDFPSDPTLSPTRIEQIRLPIMCALASEDIRRARHVKVSYDGMVYGYAIAPVVWQMARYPEMLAREVASRLMPLIYAEMSKDTTVRAELRRTHTRDELEPRVRAVDFLSPSPFTKF